MTLEQVITQCRDHIVSPYLVHYTHNTAMARRGGMVKPNTISTSFKRFVSYRDCLGAKEHLPAFTKFVRWPNAYTGNKNQYSIYLGIKASVKPIDTTMIEEKNGELLEREFGHFSYRFAEEFCRGFAEDFLGGKYGSIMPR